SICLLGQESQSVASTTANNQPRASRSLWFDRGENHDYLLRRRHPPRELLPRLLQLARQVGVAPLELLFFFLESQHLGAQPTELASQGVDVVEVDGLWRSATRRRRRRRCPSDGDLLVCWPHPLRLGPVDTLDTRLNVLPAAVALRVGGDFPLTVRVGEA